MKVGYKSADCDFKHLFTKYKINQSAINRGVAPVELKLFNDGIDIIMQSIERKNSQILFDYYVRGIEKNEVGYSLSNFYKKITSIHKE
jgi:hypothetical protein